MKKYKKLNEIELVRDGQYLLLEFLKDEVGKDALKVYSMLNQRIGKILTLPNGDQVMESVMITNLRLGIWLERNKLVGELKPKKELEKQLEKGLEKLQESFKLDKKLRSYVG